MRGVTISIATCIAATASRDLVGGVGHVARGGRSTPKRYAISASTMRTGNAPPAARRHSRTPAAARSAPRSAALSRESAPAFQTVAGASRPQRRVDARLHPIRDRRPTAPRSGCAFGGAAAGRRDARRSVVDEQFDRPRGFDRRHLDRRRPAPRSSSALMRAPRVGCAGGGAAVVSTGLAGVDAAVTMRVATDDDARQAGEAAASARSTRSARCARGSGSRGLEFRSGKR